MSATHPVTLFRISSFILIFSVGLICLGLWDVYNPDEEKCVEVLGPHTSQVNCTSFDRCNPAKILTSSLDGTVRRGDLMKLVFDEVCNYMVISSF